MILSCLMLASALSAGNAEFDRTAAEGAARITMERYVKELRDKGLQKGVLESEMLADPGRFASRAGAEGECRTIYLARAEQAFTNKLEEVRRSLSLDDSFRFDFADDDRAAVVANFPKAFEAERRLAVDTQARHLVGATRPSEAEFEEKSDDVLRREMTERVVKEQKTPVFEENLTYISAKIVDPVIAGARDEAKRQREYLMRARSDAFAPSHLKRDLEARLKANVAQRAKDVPAEEAWGIFPSVLSKSLDEAVERRTVNKLKIGVDDVRIEVKTDDVARVIAADPASHVRFSASEKAFAAVYGASVLSNGLEKVLRVTPDAEKAEFESFITERLGSDDVTKAVEKVVRREIMPKWKTARAEVAAEAARKVWPTLEDGTWYPDATLADDTLSRSDYRKTIGQWRKVDAMESLAAAPGGRPVMEESAKRADERVAAAFELARTALAAQNKIVDSTHDSVLAEARAAKASSFKKTPDLEAIVAMLTDATNEKWEESRLKTLWPEGGEPANAEEQHTELFPSVRKKIELIARKILEEMNIPEPRPDEQSETPEDSSDGDGESMELEFTISVARTSSGVEVKLMKGDSAVVERTVDAKFAPFDKAMKEVSRKLGKELLSLP